jgi:multisubunit Na+/H+ antiporter MnhG subunit
VVNGFFAVNRLQVDQDFFTRALAMSVGDFVGSLILLLSFAMLAKLYDFYKQRPNTHPN